MLFSSTNNCQASSQVKSAQKLTIRHAKTSDIPEIADTIVSSFYDFPGILSWLHPVFQFTVGEDLNYRLRYRPPLYECLVATIAENERSQPVIVGTIEISCRHSFWSFSPQYPYICNLAIKNNYRRQGIGRQLLNKCEHTALSWGYSAIQLHVLANNTAAQQLYLNNGYQVIRQEIPWNQLFNSNSARLLLRKQI